MALAMALRWRRRLPPRTSPCCHLAPRPLASVTALQQRFHAHCRRSDKPTELMMQSRSSCTARAGLALAAAVLIAAAGAAGRPARHKGLRRRTLADGGTANITGRVFYLKGGVRYWPEAVQVTCWDSDITASMFTFASHDQLCTAQTDDTGSFVCTYTVDSAWYAENPDVFCDFSKPGEIFDYRDKVICADCK